MSDVRINTPNIIDIVHHECLGQTISNSTGRNLDGVGILSRYLRPSLSSCHDFCKFGIERALEIKAGDPIVMPKRNTEILVEGLDVERTSISADRKKKLALRLESLPASRTQKLVFPTLDAAFSPLTMEQTVSSGQVSPPVKEIEFSVIRVEDRKMKPADDPKLSSAEDSKVKPLRPNQSSRRMERCSNNEGQIKIETSKERGNLSPRGSSSQRSKAKRSKGMGSFVTGERKALLPSSLDSYAKDSLKKVSSRNYQNSNNSTGVPHFSNKRTVRKPQPEQPNWDDVPEKTLHVVEPNAEGKTPRPTKNEICVTDLSPPSFSSDEDKSLEHAQKGSLNAQPCALSPKRNLRCTLNSTPAINSPSSQPPSAKQKFRHTESGIQAANSTPSCPPSAKQNSRRMQSGIQAADSSLSCPSSAKQNSRRMQSGIQAADSSPSCPSSAKRNSRHKHSGIQAADSSPSCPSSAKRKSRRMHSGIQAADSSPSCPSSAKKNLGRMHSGIQAANSPPSCPPSAKQNLRLAQSRIQAANPPPLCPSAKQNLRHTPSQIQSGNSPSSHPPTAKQKHTWEGSKAANSPPFFPPFPRKRGSRGTLFRTHTSSLASLTTYSSASSVPAETDSRNKISGLKKKYKNDLREGGSISSKEENVPGKKLTFRRGKVIDIHPVDSTPRRLKFRCSVLGERENGKGDASKETPGKKEANTARLPPSTAKRNSTPTENRIRSTQSHLSRPPYPKNEGLGGTRPGIRIARSYLSSLASMSADRETASDIGETDAEIRKSYLERENKNRPQKGPNTLKDEQYLGQKLTFRRGKVVELHPVDSNPTRLKFKKRVSGDSQNGEADAGRKTVEKKEGTSFQLSSFFAKKKLGQSKNRDEFSHPSLPSSPKKKGLRCTELKLGSSITRSYSCTSSLASLSMNGDETETEKQILDLENEFKNMHEKDGKISSKEESDLAQKPTYGRGKVVDIIHSKDSALRRLKFKRRDSLCGDSNQNDAGITFLGKQETNGGTKTESKDVVLKHQDVEEKNSGSLLNNVIEETVSELVKTRKSKVKALVGAFESVISLRDTKPTH